MSTINAKSYSRGKPCTVPSLVEASLPFVPRQHILGITPGISFLGHPTPSRLAAWSPTPALPEHVTGFPVPCIHSFVKLKTGLRDLRTVLYTGFTRSAVLHRLARKTWNLSLLGLPLPFGQ
jgi:hypothetical protein